MPASASPITPSRRSRPQRRRASTTATLPRSSMRRAIRANNSSRTDLLQRHRDETKRPVGRGDQQEGTATAVAFHLVHAFLEIGRARDFFLPDLDNDVTD